MLIGHFSPGGAGQIFVGETRLVERLDPGSIESIKEVNKIELL